jgi:predicted RNA polymerase sigma factor
VSNEEVEAGFAQDDLDMVDRIEELQGALSALVAHLKEIEWAGEIQGDACCPACVGRKLPSNGVPESWLPEVRVSYGHRDCWLAKAIGGDHA